MTVRRIRQLGSTLIATLAIAVPLAAQQGNVGQARQQQTQAAQPEPKKKLQPGDIELQSSRVYCFVGKTGFGHEHAIEGTLNSGAIRLGATDKAGKFEFDLRSFQADTQAARTYIGLAGATDAGTVKKVQTNMLGPEVLDTARFPTALFEISAARKHVSKTPPATGQEYLIEGDITLHGVKRPMKFVALAESAEGWTHLRGRFAIRQTDFGIKPFTAALGAVGITNELTIYGDLWVAPEVDAAK